MEPFIGSAAVRRGEFTRRSLARECRPIYRDVYLHRDIEMTAQLKARAAWLATRMPLCGLSAAAVLGTKWLDPVAPAEVLRQDRHSQSGVLCRSYRVAAAEICDVDGLPATTPARTAFDIGRGWRPDKSVPILDALLAATGIDVAAIAAVAESWPGVRGVKHLRSVLGLLDGGAESPQETRLRLILVRGGLPKPTTQIEFAHLRIRVDLGWREWKVAVEYDGVQHWTDGRQRSWDIERIALLEAEGWSVMRVSAEMLTRPQVIVDRVRAKLRAAGCPI